METTTMDESINTPETEEVSLETTTFEEAAPEAPVEAPTETPVEAPQTPSAPAQPTPAPTPTPAPSVGAKGSVEAFAALEPASWANIQKASEQLSRPIADIVKEIQETSNEPYLASQTEENRTRMAIRIVWSRLATNMLTKGDNYEILVLDITSPQVRKTKSGFQYIANVTGVGVKSNDDNAKPNLVEMVFFGEPAMTKEAAARGITERVFDAEPGKGYKVFAGGALKDGFYQLSGNQSTNFKTEVEVDGLDPIAILQTMFPVVTIKDAADSLSKGFNDYRLIKGNVTNVYVRPNKNGDNYGRYSIIDDTVTAEEITSGNIKSFSIMADAAQVRYGFNSELWFLGTTNTNAEYGPGMNAKAIIPVFALPFENPATMKTIEDSETEVFVAEDSETVDFTSFTS